MDIGVDQGLPHNDFITLEDGSCRFRDPVTGTFMIDRFNLSFDQYRDRRRYNMNKRAWEEASKLYLLRNPPPVQQPTVSTDVLPAPPSKPPDYRMLYLGVSLVLLSLVLRGI